MEQRQFAKALRKNMTDAEQLLWRHLRAHRLGGQKFRRPQPIGPYIVDFVHFGARVVIEADGGQHSGSADDAARDAWLQSQGFRVLRFWNDEILLNIDAVLEAILKELAKDAALPQPLSRKGRGEVTELDCTGIPMSHNPQIRIPATYMRGGTSKGVFFRLEDLPEAARVPGAARDALLQRVIGSPDPYGKQIDGMGGATSSTSKTVIVSRSTQPDHDVDYLFGQVAIDKAFVDWSGNCGNLSAAVGPFAISADLVDAARVPRNGVAIVRIWQANIGKTIIAHVPMTDGAVQETGDFELDGVTFPAAEVQLEFMDPAAEEEGAGGAMFPTGNLVDDLEVPDVGTLKATMINAGIPTIFVEASAIGYTGTELQDAINSDAKALAIFEAIRAHGALRMGLINSLEEIATRQHTPKVAFVAPPADYAASSGKTVKEGDVDLLVRAMSMGKLHHAMMGTAAVAIGTAAAISGTLVNLAAGGGERRSVRFGHPSGTLRVGAEATLVDGTWGVAKAMMSRSARVLMEGWVRVPAE